MTDYYVPKRRITAEARVAGVERRTWEIFVGETAAHHSGPERPSDLLNQKLRFLAVLDTDSGFYIVNVAHLTVLSVPAAAEFHTAGLSAEDLAAATAISVPVELLLATGDTISGTLVYLQPAGQQRVQDYMNAAPDFIVVRDGDTAHLVNTRSIVRVVADEQRTRERAPEPEPPDSLEEIFTDEAEPSGR